MFAELEFEVLDEVIIGPKKKPGTHIRLIKTKKDNLLIQGWNNIGESWSIMYRYGDIEGTWASWKRIEKNINERKKAEQKPVATGSKRKPKDKGAVSRTTKRSSKSSRVG